MKDCLRKRGLEVRQSRRMVQDRSEWQGFVRGNEWGHSPEDEPKTLTRYHNCGLSQLYEACGWKSVCGQAYNLKSIKGKIYFLSFLS